ncbi:MAG TPA: lytic murein transglycosylase [Pseudonocardiaceae bacterium]
MTGRNGTGRSKRLAVAVLAGWLLLIPATLVSTGGRLFLPMTGAIAGDSSMPDAGDLLAALHSATAGPEEYGASGNLPESDTLSPDLLDALAGPATSTVPGLSTGAGPLATVPPGPLGLPGVVLEAYMRAAQTIAATSPRCGLHWSVLAAIGRIESNHARGGAVDAKGTTVQPILGPQLSGGPGIAAIRDTDGGALDGDTVWDRAVGPMQFIPGTWARYGVDGNGDGTASPHNIHDATLAAGRYLCAGGGDLRDLVALAEALFHYNASDAYVANVLSWAAAYAAGVTPLPSSSATAPVVTAGDLAAAAAVPITTSPDATVPLTTSTADSSTVTTMTTDSSTATTGTTTATTTTTCPTAPTSTDPSSTTTVPPGCETTTSPPSTPPSTPSSSESGTTTTDPPTQTQTQGSATGSSGGTSAESSQQSSGQSSVQNSTDATLGAASTTTSLPAT